MLEYWMASNETGRNGSDAAIEALLLNPGSAVLFQDYPRWLLHFAAGCCVLFMLIGIPGNLFTVIALFLTKKLRNATAIFIMNLSISDLMFCCFNLPLAASTFWYKSWHHGPLLCQLFPLLRYGLVAVSLFTILAITINRYVMIGYPRLYPILYRRKFLIPMVAGTWIVAFSILIITWFGKWGRFGLDPAIGSCSILPDVTGRSPKEFLFVVAFLTPCLCIVICYARIFYIVRKAAFRTRKQKRIRNTGTSEQHSTSSEKQEGKIAGSDGNQGVLCTTFSLKSTGNYKPRGINHREISLQTATGEATSNASSMGQEATKVIEYTTDSKSQQSEIETESGRYEDVTKIEGVIKIDDIPFADEHEDADIKETNTFLNCNRHKKSSSIENDRSENTRDFMESQLRISRQSSQRKVKIYRKESKLIHVGRPQTSDSPPKMSSKDKKLLKMILVIFSSFLICYLPITVTKIFKNAIDWRGLNIAGYILIYLTTCINPVVYVVMSSEYRSAYKNILLCRSDSVAGNQRRKSIR